MESFGKSLGSNKKIVLSIGLHQHTNTARVFFAKWNTLWEILCGRKIVVQTRVMCDKIMPINRAGLTPLHGLGQILRLHLI